MRVRLLVLAAVLVVVAVQLSREPGSALAPVAPAPTSPPATAPEPGTADEPTPWPVPSRDPFRFGEPTRVVVAARAAPPAPAVASTPSPPPPPLRLVGLVRRGGAVKAALAVDGEVSLASVGDTVAGFSVLAIDEEAGVRVRGLDGALLALPLPEEP